MCGIAGIYAFNMVGQLHMINLARATESLQSRGPDFQQSWLDDNVGLGHRRLSIIDTSPNGIQPMMDETGRYVIVFNGEIYNYKNLRSDLIGEGIRFQSETDTEVLLHLLIKDGISALDKLNGFFSFAFFDKESRKMIAARDRYGIKPFVYFLDRDKLIFASEMKALFQFGIERSIDYNSLLWYLRLNYVPAPNTMISGIRKLEPGCYLKVEGGSVTVNRYYDLDKHYMTDPIEDYKKAKTVLRETLEKSVSDRLYADVELGSFLSGGIDSSIVSAIAAKENKGFKTFSIGFKDQPFFDESEDANLVAKHIGSDHKNIVIDSHDLLQSVDHVLDYLDEPFADSSAIAVNVLSRETKKFVTVALSGDGADELFGGYNKHKAFYRIQNQNISEIMIGYLGWLWKTLPSSRHGWFGNKIRQFSRFATAQKLNPSEAYWFLATFNSFQEVHGLLSQDSNSKLENHDPYEFIDLQIRGGGLNDFLRKDTELVLPNDMLHKVDMMSMANSLEVRVPFLDHKVVELAMNIPSEFKTNRKSGKLILRDAFSDLLPKSVLKKPKHGFEVPLNKWLKKDLSKQLWSKYLDEEFLEEQNIFNRKSVLGLKGKLHSSNPGDSHSTLWALLVFQHWYRKYLR